MALTDPVLRASVLGLADAVTGQLYKRYTLGAWGQATADTGMYVRFRLAGAQYDQETGLYYMRARYYDPELGRFLSEDPIGIAGGLNLYAYAGNDPVNAWDPSGADPCNPSERGHYNADGSATLPDECVDNGKEPLPERPDAYCYLRIGGGTECDEEAYWNSFQDPIYSGQGGGGRPAAPPETQPTPGDECARAADDAFHSFLGDLGLLYGVREAKAALRLASLATKWEATYASARVAVAQWRTAAERGLAISSASYAAGQLSIVHNSAINFVPIAGSFRKLYHEYKTCIR